VGCAFFVSFFCLSRSFGSFGSFSFVVSLVHLIFLGQAWAEGNGELPTCRHRADSDRKWIVHTLAVIYLGRMRVMFKLKKRLCVPNHMHMANCGVVFCFV